MKDELHAHILLTSGFQLGFKHLLVDEKGRPQFVDGDPMTAATSFTLVERPLAYEVARLCRVLRMRRDPSIYPPLSQEIAEGSDSPSR